MARPFATVDRARRAVQALPEPWNRDVIVWLRAGTYELSSTLELSTGDSGKNGYRVIYQPYGYGTPRQETVALSGGTRVTGWSDPDGDGIYEARTPSGAFRQLYVNGQRATRARAPNADADDYREDAYVPIAHWDSPGYEYDADPNEGNRRIGLKAADVPASLLKLPASQLHRVELVVQRKWAQNRVRIDSLSPEGPLTYLVPMEPERALFGFGPPRIDGQWAHLENAFVLLDAPGEWFLDVDAQKVYYKPRPGEDMKAAVVATP